MKILHALILAMLFAASTETIAACALADDGTPVCAYWTRADAVFTGKAVKVEDAAANEGFPAGARKVRFQVQQNYKGADNPTFTVVVTADCGLKVKSGQTWIIYAANDIVLKSFSAFRGVHLEPKIVSEEAGVLKNIVDGKSDTAISGRFVTADRVAYLGKPVEIIVAGGGSTLSAQTDATGAFNVAVPPDATYKVELKFPYRASFKWDDNLLGAQLTEGIPTVFKYEVKLNDGDCHFSIFEVADKKN